MGGWEALRRVLSHIYGREVRDDDAALIKVYPKGSAPTTGDVIFPVYAFTPQSCPPGYEYYTDTSGNIAVKCLHNTSGAMTVTEASAASSAVFLQTTANATYSMTRPMFGTPAGGSADRTKIFSVDLTSDGAGAIAATTIVPALAGYTGHAQVIGVWAAATDAATTWTFACAAGTLLGPAVHTNATTANAVTQFGAVAANQTGCPIYIRGTLAADDNKALTVSAAGYAPTQTATIFGYYWYET